MVEEDMEEEALRCEVSDDDLYPAHSPIASRWSISTLVKSVCSLSNIAGDTFEILGTKTFLENLAKNDLLYEEKSVYVCGQIGHLQKSHSTRRPAYCVVLPPFPLRRRWSELALPTFVTSEKENRRQECDHSRALYTSEEIINVDTFGETSEGAHVVAQIEETGNNGTFSQTTRNVLQPLMETNSKKIQEAEYDGDSLEKNISVDWDDISSQNDPPQHNRYEVVKDTTSRNEEPQEESIASSKHSRRCLKGVRKHVRNMFRTLCCCFPVGCRKHTTSRHLQEPGTRSVPLLSCRGRFTSLICSISDGQRSHPHDLLVMKRHPYCSLVHKRQITDGGLTVRECLFFHICEHPPFRSRHAVLRCSVGSDGFLLGVLRTISKYTSDNIHLVHSFTCGLMEVSDCYIQVCRAVFLR